MQKKVEKKNPLQEDVDKMLTALGVDIKDEKTKASLQEITQILLIVINQYCETKEVNAEKIDIVLEEIKSTYPQDIELRWLGLPVAEYIQNTIESQWFVANRDGWQKSLRLILFNVLIIELGKLKTLEPKQKIDIAKSFLDKTLEDGIWASGEKGKEAIEACLANYTHITSPSVLGNKGEKLLLEVTCEASSIISGYRSHANSQFDYAAFISFGYFKRQGPTNLEQFDSFLKESRKIIQDTSKTPVERINDMIVKLNGIRQHIVGPESTKNWQKLYNAFNGISKALKIEASKTEEAIDVKESKTDESSLAPTI